ncbi:hypothetical protein GV829_04495 [Sphingomonas lacunae]|uniref:Uncharacterized protein n=1 Tax=Sphingomonas lacunae TaxID=2698828 RepID=A0A6M4ARV9_9SPHN|nr:hypothetical protein [Sphingomonas lacunae]QJQ31794.1 hypothetical protein GV829_04495 [Sphingomonas lacunae]
MTDTSILTSAPQDVCPRVQAIAEQFRLWTRRYTRSMFGNFANITLAEHNAEAAVLEEANFPIWAGNASEKPITGWNPIYFNMDSGDIMGFYCRADAVGDDTWQQVFNFLHSALPYAYESAEGIGVKEPVCLISILGTFGPAIEQPIHDLVLELLAASRLGGIRLQAYVTASAEGDDLPEPREEFAPLDTADGRFEEASFDFCSLDAEHATACWGISFSGNGWDELVTLIQERSEAASNLLKHGSAANAETTP